MEVVARPTDVPLASNHARPRRIEIRQSKANSFGTTKIADNDFHCAELLLMQPAGVSDPQELRLEGCWLDDRTNPVEIRTRMLRDAEQDPANGVLAIFARIQARPLDFAGGPRANSTRILAALSCGPGFPG